MSRAAAAATSKISKVKTKRATSREAVATAAGRVKELVRIAAEHGLLRHGKTVVIRGRMPPALVAQAKAKTGITSDSELIEAALANLAVADDYAEWLIAQRGKIDAAIDLEF